MIEEGIFQLVSTNAGFLAAGKRNITAQNPDTGLYPNRLPDEPTYPAAVYHFISRNQQNLLADPNGVVKSRVQFSCFGQTAMQAIGLCRSVIACLNGYQGTLRDSSQTRVLQILLDNEVDSDASDAKAFLRILDFLVWYAPAPSAS